MNEAQMETEIKELGLVYPRVRLEQIDALMATVEVHTYVIPGTTTTVATAMLPIAHIKFTLANEIMACVDPRNFNAELGVKYGTEKVLAAARNKLWELEGYALAKQLLGA